MISGDRNDLKMSVFSSIDPSLRQIVQTNTRGANILDVIATNIDRYYNDPVIIPPVPPDRPGHGVASDHMGGCVTPLSCYAKVKVKVEKVIQSQNHSYLHLKQSFQSWISKHWVP